MARDATKLQYWSEQIKNWQASGLAQRAYCAREDIKWSTFDYWRRQLRANSDVTRPAKKRSIGGLTLVPAHVSGKSKNDTIVLRSLAGWELRLPIAVDAAWFAELLKRLP